MSNLKLTLTNETTEKLLELIQLYKDLTPDEIVQKALELLAESQTSEKMEAKP